MSSTEDVVGHHLQSFGAGDIDELMKDYTDESILITPEATLTGAAQIKPLLEEFVTTMIPPGSEFEMIRQDVQGDVAFIVWKASSEKFTFHLATDTFVIIDGKIATQTFAAHIDPK